MLLYIIAEKSALRQAFCVNSTNKSCNLSITQRILYDVEQNKSDAFREGGEAVQTMQRLYQKRGRQALRSAMRKQARLRLTFSFCCAIIKAERAHGGSSPNRYLYEVSDDGC